MNHQPVAWSLVPHGHNSSPVALQNPGERYERLIANSNGSIWTRVSGMSQQGPNNNLTEGIHLEISAPT